MTADPEDQPLDYLTAQSRPRSQGNATAFICGAEPLLARARALRDQGEPDNREAWLLWRDLFAGRIAQEPSLMARGAFHSAVREAEARLGEMGG